VKQTKRVHALGGHHRANVVLIHLEQMKLLSAVAGVVGNALLTAIKSETGETEWLDAEKLTNACLDSMPVSYLLLSTLCSCS